MESHSRWAQSRASLRRLGSQRAIHALGVCVCLILLLGGGLWVTGVAGVEAQAGAPYYTLRVYGRGYFGAGAPNVVDPGAGLVSTIFDPVTGAVPEDAPYTDLLGVFHPQHPEAPQKDHVTWNPAYMAEGFTFDENQRKGLYNQMFANGINIAEKVWHRHWYEPEHWDKDINSDDRLTRDPKTGKPTDPRTVGGTTVWLDDIWYPAIMQEFTYILMQNQEPIPRGVGKPEPIFGRAGTVQFVFPVGMRGADLFGPDGQIDINNGVNDTLGYGLTSLDADFDNVPEIVHVDSELSLFEKTGVAADFNGDGVLQGLRQGSATTPDGTELAVLHVNLSSRPLRVGQYAQFLDHVVKVSSILNESVNLEFWYTGDLRPRYIGSEVLFVNDMALAGTQGPVQLLRNVRNGGTGGNLCAFPTGPWFAYVDTVDTVDGTVALWLGRGLGRPFTAMEDAPGVPDRRPGDPWFLKRFYVDGHEYNVVALSARGNGAPIYPTDCDLDDDNDRVIDTFGPQDPSDFEFITLRQPIPKGPDILNAQHSVRLKGYQPDECLPKLPPYNYEHYIFSDIQPLNDLTGVQPAATPSGQPTPTATPGTPETLVGYIGKLIGPVPPILQKHGPVPYITDSGAVYDNPRELAWQYRLETTEPAYLGALKEKYGELPGITGQPPTEFFFTEQFWTLPWNFTEFVLPDLSATRTGTRTDPVTGAITPDNDLYLLTSAFFAPQGLYQLWVQNVANPFRWGDWNQTVIPPPGGLQNRVKFWFDPASSGDPTNNPSGKIYKDGNSLRIYGKSFRDVDDFTGTAGDLNVVTDPISGFRVEVPPYTDPWAPFNPQLPQAPRKDSVTFNPVYMDEFRNSGEPIASLYGRISIEEADGREKVYHRMWYENSFLDKLRFIDDRGQDYRFSALMQEFTYLLLDTQDRPVHTQPGNSRFVFPMATNRDQLPVPPSTAGVGWNPPASFGFGLTSFDANFDGNPDIVTIDSERTLVAKTGIQADFNGNNLIDSLRPNALPLDGLVVFSVENITLRRGESVQFLDHLITLENIGVGGAGSNPSADFDFWYTGGGLHALLGGDYSSHPDFIRTASFNVGDMAIANRSSVRRISAGGNNLGRTDGAWFVSVRGINQFTETVVVTVGRALGATHAAIDNGQGGHNLAPGSPWYLKRFFVDGHEYNVVALQTAISDTITPQADPFEFKYITIRTPLPKPFSFVNYQDSIVLQGYFRGRVFDNPDTNVISVMPPFNMAHTIAEDIIRITPDQFASDDEHPKTDCVGPPRGANALAVRIVAESREPRLTGELRELLFVREQTGVNRDVWSTEQFRTYPDLFTDVRLPDDQLYLLTSDWTSTQSRLHFYACTDINPLITGTQMLQDDIANAWAATNPGQLPFGIPFTNTANVGPADFPVIVDSGHINFFNAEGPVIANNPNAVRVKFVYSPRETTDIYVNPGPPPRPCFEATPTPTPTRTQTATPTATPTLTRTLPPPPVTTTVPPPPGCTITGPTCTPTPTPTRTPTATPTSTLCPNCTITPTATATPTTTPCPNCTVTPTATPTQTPTDTPPNLFCVYEGATDRIVLQWTLSGTWDNIQVLRQPILNIPLLPGNASLYYDVNPSPGNMFSYQVRGIRNNVPGPLSNLVTCGRPTVTPTPPPSDLECVPINYSIVDVNWVITDPTATGIHLQRSRNGVNWTDLSTSPVVQGTRRDSGLSSNTLYFYRGYIKRGNAIDTNPIGLVSCQTPPWVDDVTGTVILQGRTNHAGARVLIDNGLQGFAITDDQGAFSIAGTAFGRRIVTIDMQGYLPISRTIEVVSVDTPLGEIHMVAGDANADNRINLFDLTIVASAFDATYGSPGWDARADINGDGAVNIFDLVLISQNFDRRGPTDGTLNGKQGDRETGGQGDKETGGQGDREAEETGSVANAPTVTARLVTRGAKDAYLVGDLVTVAIGLDGLTDFFGGQIDLAYDPTRLEVVDMNDERAGTQVTPGSLFPNGSFFAPEDQTITTDDGKPIVRFAGVRINSGTAQGAGTLVEVTFRVKGCGVTTVDLADAKLLLSTPTGQSLPVTASGSLDVRTGCLFLPMIQVGGE